MFSRLFGFLQKRPTSAVNLATSVRPAVAPIRTPTKSQERPRPTPVAPAHPRCCRLDAQPLHQFKPILGTQSLATLTSLGITTIGQLMNASPAMLINQLGGKSFKRNQIKRWRRSFRMLAELPCLEPADATMLIAVGRFRASELIRESPARLHADLRRWGNSSIGFSCVKRHRLTIPELEKVRNWVREAKRRFAAA